MTNRTKIILIASVVILILGAGLFFGYQKFISRIADNSQTIKDESSAANELNKEIFEGLNNSQLSGTAGSENTTGSGSNEAGLDTDVSESTDADVNNISGSSGEMFAHITTEHCNTDCKAFANKLEYLEYCEQVCGISPVKDVSDCDGKENLEKDYCNKDVAINKKDSSICENIEDANVKSTCKNRILEEIVENQQPGQ